MSLTLQKLAALTEATVCGGQSDSLITSAADIMSAAANQITVLSDSKYAKYLKNSQASACFIAENTQLSDIPEHLALLKCADQKSVF